MQKWQGSAHEAVVSTLAQGEDLGAGPHTYRWTGFNYHGLCAPSGLYALEVVLGEQGRDISCPADRDSRQLEDPAIGG